MKLRNFLTEAPYAECYHCGKKFTKAAYNKTAGKTGECPKCYSYVTVLEESKTEYTHRVFLEISKGDYESGTMGKSSIEAIEKIQDKIDGLKVVKTGYDSISGKVFLLVSDTKKIKEFISKSDVRLNNGGKTVKKLSAPITYDMVTDKDKKTFARWSYNQGYK